MTIDRLAVALAACAAATLIHHAHNAHFLADYPALPGWLTPAIVYLAWALATAVGVIGYLCLRAGYRLIGLGALGLYAIYALDGLTHYIGAPLSAHTPGMNVTIWLEAITGAALAWTVFSSRSAR